MSYRALITGASSGIGTALATRLAALGVDVVLVARDAARLEALAMSLPGATEVLPADLLSDEGLASVVERLQREDEPIDILVSNAGFGLVEPFDASSIDDERRLHELLTTVPMVLAHAAVPGMRARGRGWILNVASMAAFLPRGSYSAAKAYVVSLSRSLRVRLARDGIRVTVLCPGFVHTEFHERAGIVREAPDWMWADADVVAAEGIRGLRRGVAIVRSDLRYRLLTPLMTVLPDRALHAIAG